jgi:hypothetical protein
MKKRSGKVGIFPSQKTKKLGLIVFPLELRTVLPISPTV